MRAPHVLLSAVLLTRERGGVARHNRELLPRLARELDAHGGSLTLLHGRTPPPFPLPADVALRPSRTPPTPAPLRALFETRALRRELGRGLPNGEPYDLVHTAHLPAPRALGVPFTITLHHLKSPDQRHDPPLRRLFGLAAARDAVRRAARTLVVSEAERDELVRRLDADPTRIAVVPNAADHLPVLERAPAADAPLLHVGELTRRKNLELLLRALAADPGLPHLLLVGVGPPPEFDRLCALAATLGVAGRVTFRGAVDDAELARLFATSACFVLPSRREGFGIPALEARRAGLPLAVSRLPVLFEVAGPDTPSFDPDDPVECAAAIRAALATPATELERATRDTERWTWDASARRMAEALTQAARAPRR